MGDDGGPAAQQEEEAEDLPLNNEWTVWTNMRAKAGQTKEGWESSLVQLGNFTTINKFWEYCRFIHNHFEDLRSAERGLQTRRAVAGADQLPRGPVRFGDAHQHLRSRTAPAF